MKFVLALVLGLLIGGAGAYFLFVGAPHARLPKGETVRAPDAGGPPPGTAVVEVDEQVFNTLLACIYKDIDTPASPPAAGEGCQNRVVIEPNSGDVRTAVVLQNNQVSVPLAFSGTYNLMGCQNLRGTAEAAIDFRFAQEEQALYGQLNVV